MSGTSLLTASIEDYAYNMECAVQYNVLTVEPGLGRQLHITQNDNIYGSIF